MQTKTEHENTSSADEQDTHGEHGGEQAGMERKMYLRFAAMILTSMVFMYFVMFVGSWELSHVRFSQSRIFMAVTMGGTMRSFKDEVALQIRQRMTEIAQGIAKALGCEATLKT